MSKKLLGLLCILGCVVAPFGAFAGGDEGDWFTDPALLCEAFTVGTSPAENGYTTFDWTCHTDSDVCQEYRDMDIQFDDGGAYVTTCANGTVEKLETYNIMYDHGQMSVAGPCSMNYEGVTYRCKSGYYGNPTSCSSSCKLAPKNSTISSDGRSYTCNSGYTKYTSQQIRNNSNQLVTFSGCCKTSWTNSTSDSTGGSVYKYRACFPEGQSGSIGIAACRGNYAYPTSFNPTNVYCSSWNTSTLKPTARCSGCDNRCEYGTSYPPVNATMVRQQTVAKSTSTNTIYGSYISACTTTYGAYMCAVGYHADGKSLTASSTCEKCPKTSDVGLTTVYSPSTNDIWTTGTSARGAQNETDCYANSGYTDIGDTATYNDGTGTFSWESDNASYYDCHYTN